MLGALTIMGCHVWAADRGDATVVPRVSPQQELRVTRTDNRQFILREVVVSRDTLFGTNTVDRAGIVIPLADIIRVEKRKVSRPPLVAIVGVAALTLGMLFLLSDF